MPVQTISEELESENLFLISTSDKLAIDTEGNAKDVRPSGFGGQANPDAYTMGISLAGKPRIGAPQLHSTYLPFRHRASNLSPEMLARVKSVIEGHEGRIVMHNAKHDIVALRNLGIEVPQKKLFCTMLGFHWINEEWYSKRLDDVSKYYGGKPKNRSPEMQKIIDVFGWYAVPSEVMWEYAANDAFITYEADEHIWPQFEIEGFSGPLWERELKFMNIVMKMESFGVGVNLDICEQQIIEGETTMMRIRDELGLNPGSTKDLHELLINRLGLPILEEFKTPAGKPSFNKNAMAEYEAILEHRQDRTAQHVLEYRGWQKTVSSNYKAYLDLLSPDGNLRPSYKLHGTRTSRLSCEKPNLQQIPRSSSKPWNGQLKASFIARPGYTLWEADYGQLEMRVTAVYSEDEVLTGTFNRGVSLFKDMHARMPQWGYDTLKTNTYATLYGAGVRKIALLLGIPESDAAQMRDDFYGTYPRIQQVSRRAGAIARSRGYVRLWTNRRRHFNDPSSGAHKAFNSIIQGGAAEIVKSVIIDLNDVIDWQECRMLLQVHDSVVFEIANGAEKKWLPIIRDVMENVGKYNNNFTRVPFPVDIHRFGLAA